MIARREGGDAVYVFFGAGQAFHYYAQRYGLTMDNTVIGRCSIERPDQYLHQLDQFRGKPRVWILLTHDRGEGKPVIIDYLDRIGRRLEAVEVPGSSGRAVEAASGYLYDLSDPKKLTAAASSTIAIAGQTIGLSPRWECYGVGLSESP
jgi:hypothetical protein